MNIKIASNETIETFIDIAATHFFDGSHKAVKEHLENFDEHDTSFILGYKEDEPVGVAAVRWHSMYPPFKETGIPLLHNIEIRHDLKGLGYGNQLMALVEDFVARKKQHLGICVGLFDAYAAAQQLYAKRGYIPDGRGVCEGHRPLKEGENITLHHNHLLWLLKELNPVHISL